MNTDDLIENLGRGLTPITPLWPPGSRAAAWCLGAVFYLSMLVALMSVVYAHAQTTGTGFWVSQIAAVVAGLLASRAAFVSVVPGFPRGALLYALVAAVVWLGTLVATSPPDFDMTAVLAASHEWICVGFIIVGGAPLMWVLARLLRRGAPLKPATTAAFAALAVGLLTNIGACLSLPHANSAITLTWHGGVVLALVLFGGLAGYVLNVRRATPSQPIVEGHAELRIGRHEGK